MFDLNPVASFTSKSLQTERGKETWTINKNEYQSQKTTNESNWTNKQ